MRCVACVQPPIVSGASTRCADASTTNVTPARLASNHSPDSDLKFNNWNVAQHTDCLVKFVLHCAATGCVLDDWPQGSQGQIRKGFFHFYDEI